ncbi:hypothetical protein HAX54_044838 [Datura stramonium]|uniref:Uncharacterized protein n=1 Tax=Datura stramonium TaxID=4076 RepID=A0ABS8SQ21_DATST|nr:hypothetical protein [Datura stramonium]
MQFFGGSASVFGFPGFVRRGGAWDLERLSMWHPITGMVYFGDVAVQGYESPNTCIVLHESDELYKATSDFKLVGQIKKHRSVDTFLEQSFWDTSDAKFMKEPFSLWVIGDELGLFIVRSGFKEPPKRVALKLADRDVARRRDDMLVDSGIRIFSAALFDDCGGLQNSVNAPGAASQFRLASTRDLNLISVSDTNTIFQAYASWNNLSHVKESYQDAVSPTGGSRSVIDVHHKRNYFIIPENKLGQDIFVRATDIRGLPSKLKMLSGDSKPIRVPIAKNMFDSHFKGSLFEKGNTMVTMIMAAAETMWLGILFSCCTHGTVNLLLSASECNPYLSGIRSLSPGFSKTFRAKMIENSFLTGLAF